MAMKKKSALRQMPEEKLEDLLVFGYGSRIFRDDEKALFIDQGKHLLPWNGEESLMIDRYDARAFLTDLTEYDADVIRTWSEPMTEKERQVERLLDEERYLELTADYDLQMMFEEEEMKRSQERFAGSYAAVGFQYDSAGTEEANGDQQGQDSASTYDELFVPIPALKLPPDMIFPRTMKVHAIIEKTATFICKQGTQMEIVLKTKQKDNPQFEFLNYDSELNPYFKHLVSVMKDGRYIPSAHQPDPPDEDSHSYLHPSLTSTSQPEPELAPMTSQEFLESIKSKLPAGQIANTSYQVLLKNLQKHALPVAAAKPVDVHRSEHKSISSSSATAVRPSLPKAPPPPPPLGPPAPPSSVSLSLPATLLQPPTVEPGPLITPPPPDQKPIIDKMADYVARNGPEFEACVKLKNDPRFRFLDSDHVHYNYYLYKKEICIKELERQKPPPPPTEPDEMETEEKAVKADDELESDVKESSLDEAPVAESDQLSDSNAAKSALMIKGVSFSIKPKEEEVTSLKTRTALLYDSSDDDDSNSDTEKESQPPPPTMSRNSSRASLVSANHERPSGENAEKKQAEHKLADKLASAAREKLARESRERQLQAQRKRKAALFINMLKDSNSAPSPPSSGPGATAAAALADYSLAASGINSPFTSSTKSGSATPTTLLEQAALDLSRVSVPASIPSRARSRSPRKHRRRSVTPPTAYTSSRRSGSKSPSRHHKDRYRSKHRSKHSVDHRSQKSPPSPSNQSSHKKSTKDRDSSKHKKSKKSKSKHRRSDSWDELDDAHQSSSKRPRVASSISKVNPVVVDLTGGSPRAGEDGSKRSERGSKHSRR